MLGGEIMAKNSINYKKYDIFISYRRDGGILLAQLTQKYLSERYSTFLDLECMRIGNFNEQLYDVIDNCQVFVLILSPNSLDRCKNEGDWVRLEIRRALDKNKPVIPVMQHEFVFPDDLQEDIAIIRKYHGIVASDELYDVQMKKLLTLISNHIESETVSKSIDNLDIDLSKMSVFANCGKESSVFKIKKSEDNKEVSLNINFEPGRIRKEIPDYAGVYYLYKPSLNISDNKKINITMSSPDLSIETVWIELKPKGKAWMHEVFDFSLSNEYKQFEIDTAYFSNSQTLECLEEITIVLRPESFADEKELRGILNIKQISID